MAIIAVCGPMGSGKSYYVNKRKRWGDLIIDLDEIYRALGGAGGHEHPETLVPVALSVRDFLYEWIQENDPAFDIWIITGGAKRRDRIALRDMGAHVIIFETCLASCMRNIGRDETRKDKLKLWEPLIKSWWDKYERSNDDEIIRERFDP